MTPPRVLVAGAGVVGSVTAIALARAGGRVTLADPAARGANASGIAAGMLAPVFETLFDAGACDLEDLRRARDLWPAFAASVGIVLDRSGAMAVGSPDDLDRWDARLAAKAVVAERLSPAAARRRMPGLADGLGGLWTAEDWRLDVGAALKALSAAASEHGVRRVAAAVTGFDAPRATLSTGEGLDVDVLVIATGASRGLIAVAPELAVLTSIKGHILRAPQLTLRGPTIRFEGGYVCPSSDGAIIGATMEIGREDALIDPATVRRLRDAAAVVLPAVGHLDVSAASGVRGSTPDRRPLVGAGVTPGVWLAVGARRNGWLLAPSLAQRIVAALSPANA